MLRKDYSFWYLFSKEKNYIYYVIPTSMVLHETKYVVEIDSRFQVPFENGSIGLELGQWERCK